MKLKEFILLLLLAFLAVGTNISAQDFMMQGWYWDYPKKDCPDPATPTWASALQTKVNSIAQGGFTYLWLPPPTNASFGKCSNGYDPRDLYDLGSIDSTGLGTRAELDALTTALNNAGVNTVADVVYNHRDGGKAEVNQAVEDYVTIHYDATKNAFPSDRFRCILPLGGASGNNAGDYYIKISSKTGDAQFDNYAYKFYANTNNMGWQSLTDTMEIEPNGGGDCGETSTSATLGRNFLANVDFGACNVDEFKITLTASNFNTAGDTLFIYINNTGGYSDHRIYGIWNANAAMDVIGQLEYQTYTNFNAMPSGQGGMNLNNFRPTPATAATEKLDGDWNWLWFFYDYDQSVISTQTALFDWTKWLWNDAGFRGFRMDAVKHFDYAFVGDLLDYLHDNSIDPEIVVGEFFDSNVGLLNGWINNVENNMDADTKAAIDVRLFDFSMREKLKNVCDNGHDARDIFNAGMVAAGANGKNVVTFLNNHDFRHAFEPVWNDQILAYTYLLTNNQIGLPCVFYAEYFGVQPSSDYPNVNLKTQIDELISIHKNYIFGSPKTDYLSRHSTPYYQFFNTGSAGADKVLIYQMAASGLVGGKEIIVAINFGNTALDMWQAINFDVDNDGTNNYGVGETFVELTDNSPLDLTVFAPNNDVHIKLPAKSYAVWVQGAILPVRLERFEVQEKHKNALLHWKTSNEVNFSHFEIERSLDRKTFNKIGTLLANSTGDYQFVDNKPPLNKKLFYRLKMLDFDGSFKYSAIKNLKINAALTSLKLSPNPANNNLNINFHSDIQTKVTIELCNTLGAVIMTLNKQIRRGEQNIKINISSLPKGLYFLQLGKATNSSLTAKFIKK